ncbi:MAG: hypothetical protein JWQ67_2560 [Marmoricola sp.]|jgi:hypothetical protein|nr:hypothetical protein [Marmoricola sp.]MCW2828944.1 hypothetical protein [Marmoricola sp.]
MPVLAGKALVDPTDAQVVEAWGVPTSLNEEERDFDGSWWVAVPPGASSLTRHYLGSSRSRVMSAIVAAPTRPMVRSSSATTFSMTWVTPAAPASARP